MMLSVVVATKNEELNIEACLRTVKWADEIVVIDMESTDRTRELAGKLGARVYVSAGGLHKLIPYNKNLGIKKAKGEWVMIVDADERVSRQLAEEIMRAIKSHSRYVAYKFPIPTYYWGKWIFHGWDLDQVRLFRKDSCSGYTGKMIHDVLGIRGSVGKLYGRLYHLGHLTFHDFIETMNCYTTTDTALWFQAGAKEVRFVDLFKNSLANFYYQYFRFKGYKDGIHGLTMCLLMAIYHFVERAKLWELEYKKKNDELHKFDEEFYQNKLR